MSIACFWSNLLIKFIYPRMDITSNARIEKYFGKVKHNIMKGNLNQRPTNFIRLLEEDILSTVRQIDLGFEDVFATKKGLENAKRREHSRQYIFNYEGLESEESCIPENLEQCRDIWRSKYHPKGGLFSHLFQKGVSNKDRAILPFQEKSYASIKEIINVNDVEIREISSIDVVPSKITPVEYEHPPLIDKEIRIDADSSNDCLLKYKNRIPILKDEQLNSLQIHPDHKFINYELISLEGKTKFFIGKIADLSVIGLDIQAITAEMLAVLNPDIWLDADTIAILIGLYIERSGQRNVRLVSSYNIKYLLEPGKIQSVSRNSGLAFILSNTNGIWICPLHTMGSTTPCRTIIDGNHWVLMILDFQAKKFFYLDPLKARSSCAAEVKTTVLSNLKFICSANGKTFDDKNGSTTLGLCTISSRWMASTVDYL
uniref:Ubiquitin-like protease family profile domain-containing protein n=1 Tax=Megaselia scalaris TaxID=36166 RepID=T1GPT8_MEGSC